MPKKIKPAQDQDNGIELTSMDVTSSDTKQDTHDDSEDEWELISPVNDGQHGATTTTGSGAALTPAANSQPGPEQPASAYLEPLYAPLRSIYTLLTSARNDIANGSEHIGGLTSMHLSQATSALHPALSLPIRAGVEATYYLTQQLTSHLPDMSQGQPQPALQPSQVQFSDKDEVRTFTPEKHESPSDDDTSDGEQDAEESEEPDDSEEHHDREGASDADSEEEPDGPAGSDRSAGADGSEDSDEADSAHDACPRDTDDAPSSPEQTPTGNQLALKNFTIPVAFLLAAPDPYSAYGDAVPAAAIGNGFLPEEGLDISTAALAVGLAIKAYLIGAEMPDWSATDCHLVGQPLPLLAGLVA